MSSSNHRFAHSLFEEGLIPPSNFSMVDNGIFRSDYPGEDSIDFFKSVGLRSIIGLYSGVSYSMFTQLKWNQNKIRVFSFRIDDGKEPYKNIDAALEVLKDVTNHPVLIYSVGGERWTCCLVGCYRRLQNWCLSSIFEEYKRFAAAAEARESEAREAKARETREADKKFITSFICG